MNRPDSPSWTAAKSAGDKAELHVARYFGLRGFDCHKTIGQVPYDLLLLGRVEVKCDLLAPSTGRVAVELAYAGEPSGITDTLATYWAIVAGDTGIVIPTRRLRDLVQRADVHVADVGDGRKSRCALLPLALLRNAAHVRTFQIPGGAT